MIGTHRFTLFRVRGEKVIGSKGRIHKFYLSIFFAIFCGYRFSRIVNLIRLLHEHVPGIGFPGA
jgi:hypothetical protein